MLNSFRTIGEQILIVFLLMAVGYIGGKRGMIDNALADGMTDLCMKITIPLSIILAFQREFETRLVREFLLSILLAGAGYLIASPIAWLTIRDPDRKRQNTLRFTAIFSNCAMMAIPLQEAMFGTDGVFCGAAAVAMFNIVFWPFGTAVMAPAEKQDIIKKSLLNPCVLATAGALLLFFFRISIPAVPAKAISHLAALNLPLCMIVLGQKLTRKPLRQLFADRGGLLAAAERLVLFPLLMILLLLALNIRGTTGMCALTAMASPAAASVVMIAVAYRQDAELAASSVAVSTVLSLITMPLMIALGGWLLL